MDSRRNAYQRDGNDRMPYKNSSGWLYVESNRVQSVSFKLPDDGSKLESKLSGNGNRRWEYKISLDSGRFLTISFFGIDISFDTGKTIIGEAIIKIKYNASNAFTFIEFIKNSRLESADFALEISEEGIGQFVLGTRTRINFIPKKMKPQRVYVHE